MYDIRGQVPSEIDEGFARALGLAFGALLRERGKERGLVAVGMDARTHSPSLKGALVEGLTQAGFNVVDIGLVPTPVLYFATFQLDVVGGIQVTASHNPPQFNGFKLAVGHDTIYGEEIQRVRQLMEAEPPAPGGGKVEEYDIVPDYISWVVENVKVGQVPAFAFDSGNGAAGPVAKALYERLGLQFKAINLEPDGRFPAHLPDPTVPKYMAELRELVLSEGFAFGIGFDGDGDRIGVIDEHGNLVFGDQLLAILATPIVKSQPGAQIVMDVKCSSGVVEYIRELGGEPVLWKTGHSLIKAKLHELGAPMAGEMSGHMFFADRYFGYDDAVYASARLLEFLSQEQVSVSELVARIPKYYSTPEIRVPVSPEERKFEIISELVSHFKAKPGDYDVIDIDGVRLQFPDGFALARASNTQAVIVLRFEAKTPERLEEIKELLLSKLREYPELDLSVVP